MQHGKSTKITVYEDKATGIASPLHGSNVAVLAFNIGFIVHRKPALAVQIMKLYNAAQSIQKDDPQAPDEDHKAALNELKELLHRAFDK